MSRRELAASTVLRRVGLVVLVGFLLLAALMAFAAVDVGPGESRQLFTLLTASGVVFALAGGAALVASRGRDTRWTGVIVALLVCSGALLCAAGTREGGFGVLPIAGAMLLMALWLVKALRATHANGPTPAAASPGQQSG